MILADIHLGDLIKSLLVMFFMVIYFMMLFNIIIDLFRDQETGGVVKAIWAICLIALPVISMIVYLIARGDGMAKRSIAQAQANQSQLDEYLREVAASSSTDQIAQAKALLDQGAINQAEFDALKQKALA